MKVGALKRRGLLALLGAAGMSLPLAGAARAQQVEEGTFFLEVDLRIQIDLMHVMVPPSIAKYPSRVVGSNGAELTMFAPQTELKEYPNNVFLTNDSLELAAHIDSVAMLDTGQPAIGGVHGLEAGCGMRSPGRVMDGGASGLSQMWLLDGEHGASSEELYANVPTPATLHNYYQRLMTPTLRNGYTFKGLHEAKYSVYHFAAGLPDAELDRLRSKAELLAAFEADYRRLLLAGGLPRPTQVELPPYLKRGGTGERALNARFAELRPSWGDLALTPEEEAYWGTGVPPQRCSVGEAYVMDCPTAPADALSGDSYAKAQIWEQFAYATKLFRAGVTRSVAIEFDYGHLDGDMVRTESVLRESAQQIARPLARFIAQMKAAGLYDRTLVAVYLVDGSREPRANSAGDTGKGTVILAGGKIKGGYYGDITIEGDHPNTPGHIYGLRPPEPATGMLQPVALDWSAHAQRTPDASVWRTVARAMGVPESEYLGKFSALVDNAPVLECLLKA